MKILYVVHQFFPKHYTGTERFALNLSKQMQRMGHYAKILTYELADNDGFMREDGFFLKEYSFQGLPVISMRHASLPDSTKKPIFDFTMEKLFYKFLSEEDFDIIHICHPMHFGIINLIAHDLGIPIVSTLTDFWLMCPRVIAVTSKGELCNNPNEGKKCLRECLKPSQDAWIKQRFDDAREFLKNSSCIAAPTQFLADLFINAFGENINVVRHGIEYCDIKPNEKMLNNRDTVVFGYIGTILPHKGIHIVIDAVKTLNTNNIKIKIYGNYFNERDYFNSLQRKAQDDPRITFLGEYKDEEIKNIMNDVDCILCPSVWWENSPLTVLTSLAYRVPVITIDVGGAAELVNNDVNGFNFEIGDPNSLAHILEKIAKNPGLLNNIKNNIIRPRRVEEEAFDYEKIYETIKKDNAD